MGSETNEQALAPVLNALATMQSNSASDRKAEAHKFLERFQKSDEAWSATIGILQNSSSAVEAKLFAATTLKGKITYDLHQLPPDAQTPLRDSLIGLLQSYSSGPRPVRIQICVCIARLAIQMMEWKDVLGTVGPAVGNSPDGADTMLDFLRVLPEEVTEGRKINLSEEELDIRTKQLLEDNSRQVLSLLTSYAQSSASAAANPRLYECVASWMREIPIVDIVNSPLFGKIFDAISNEQSFDSAVECLCTIYQDTRDVDENLSVIQAIYPHIVRLRSRIQEMVKTGDYDIMKGMTRLFAEAGEAWVVLIARMPDKFRSLVEAVLECCVVDTDKEAIAITFSFWYELKQYITLEKYMQARATLADLYSKLVDIMIKHLEYPAPESENPDPFEGDREQEDKFREFRHAMGDVLKDCCEVIGVTECLTKAAGLIQQWAQTYGAQATPNHVPNWQQLESPVFALRGMGLMVNPEESTILPKVIPLLTQIPDHEKLKFQSIMVIGRYTEWTAQHPETLQAQLSYVISGFNHPSPEVVQAAALAFKFLGTDCKRLLGEHISQLHQFYEGVLDKLKPSSQEEVTEGVAAVISVQPVDKIYETMKLFCDLVMSRVVALAQQATDDEKEKDVADYLNLMTIFIQWIQPYVPPSEQNPAVKYCAEIMPALSGIAKHFAKSGPILEKVCRFWRYMVISYRTATVPLLQDLATSLASGFEATRQGCFLWASTAVVREYAQGAEFVDQSTTANVFAFYSQQATVFLRILSQIPPIDLPDVIEDFFRLSTDALRFYTQATITSPIAEPMVQAALTALTLQSLEPLLASLQFLRDFLDFGLDKPPTSTLNESDGQLPSTSPQIRASIHRILASHGQELVNRVLTGMMYSFPEDVYPEASGILLSLFQLAPHQAAQWLQGTIQLLPAGSLKPAEANKLMKGISDKMAEHDIRKVRVLLQDFTTSYRRRNVAPREGLGRLEAREFRFSG